MTTEKKDKSSAAKFLEKLIRETVTFAFLIRDIRTEESMTQEEFAEMIGVTKSHICDIEKGRKFVSPARAAFFAKKLNYPTKLFVEIALQDIVRRDGLKFKVSISA